jgi:hypothetical protein
MGSIHRPLRRLSNRFWFSAPAPIVIRPESRSTSTWFISVVLISRPVVVDAPM